MKRLFSSLTAMTICMAATASILSPGEALSRLDLSRKIAPSYLGNISAPQLVFAGQTPLGEPAYYIFKDRAATLFLSADDKARPLLGYTSTADFDSDNLPPSLYWWLGEYAREIEWMRELEKTGQIRFDKARKVARETAADSREPISPMVTTLWDQGEPFNLLCPEKNGERTVTGCVATAMAQLMNYFKWPVSEVPALSYYWNGELLSSEPSVIEWNEMLDSYNGSFQEDQAMAVARLMQLAGYSVEMEYGTHEEGGSMANSMASRNALVDTFGYDVATDYTYRTFFTTEQWEDMIYENLLNVGPLYYAGSAPYGRHAFVCDGYDGNGYFHINWGWGGMEDGWFLLSALDPEIVGIGGSEGGFNYDQSAMFGMQPPVAGSVPPKPFMACSDNLAGFTEGNQLVFVAEDEEGGFWNYGWNTVNYGISVKITNTGTGDTLFISEFEETFLPLYGYYDIAGDFNDSIPDGNYDATLVYRLDGGEWVPFRFPVGSQTELNVDWKDGVLTLNGEQSDRDYGRITILDYDFAPDPMVAGQSATVYFTVGNSFKSEKTVPIRVILCNQEEGSLQTKADFGIKDLTIEGQAQKVVSYETVLPLLPEDTYYLVWTDEDYNMMAWVEVPVDCVTSIAGPAAEEGKATLYTLNGQPVATPDPLPGIYIRKQGNSTKKILIR